MSDNEKSDGKLINYKLLRLIVGAIGLSLGPIVYSNASRTLDSISHSYHDDNTRDFFVGALCFIGAFLCVYQGNPRTPKTIISEALLSKIAGISAIVVAFVPTAEAKDGSSPLHFIAAAVVFLVLAYFCLFSFREQSADKEGKLAKFRKWVYVFCGITMLGCMAAIMLDKFKLIPDFTSTVFWGETIALIAFGIAWVTASQTALTSRDPDRLKIFKELRNI